MTEHYDNAWDTELTPELEAALNTDDPLCDHTMRAIAAGFAIGLIGPDSVRFVPSLNRKSPLRDSFTT